VLKKQITDFKRAI